MTLEQTLDSSNNTNIAVNHNMAGWSSAQKMSNDVHHAARMDKKQELEHSNLIFNTNMQQQAIMEEQISQRLLNRMMLLAGANKMLNLDPEDSVAVAELFKGKANSDILSIIGQNKAGAMIPPETGVASQMAHMNALNAQNNQNQSASIGLAGLLTGATMALNGIINKTMYNVPPVGTTPIEKPVAGQV